MADIPIPQGLTPAFHGFCFVVARKLSGYALRANPTYPTCAAQVLARIARSSKVNACRTVSSGSSSN